MLFLLKGSGKPGGINLDGAAFQKSENWICRLAVAQISLTQLKRPSFDEPLPYSKEQRVRMPSEAHAKSRRAGVERDPRWEAACDSSLTRTAAGWVMGPPSAPRTL